MDQPESRVWMALRPSSLLNGSFAIKMDVVSIVGMSRYGDRVSPYFCDSHEVVGAPIYARLSSIPVGRHNVAELRLSERGLEARAARTSGEANELPNVHPRWAKGDV